MAITLICQSLRTRSWKTTHSVDSADSNFIPSNLNFKRSRIESSSLDDLQDFVMLPLMKTPSKKNYHAEATQQRKHSPSESENIATKSPSHTVRSNIKNYFSKSLHRDRNPTKRVNYFDSEVDPSLPVSKSTPMVTTQRDNQENFTQDYENQHPIPITTRNDKVDINTGTTDDKCEISTEETEIPNPLPISSIIVDELYYPDMQEEIMDQSQHNYLRGLRNILTVNKSLLITTPFGTRIQRITQDPRCRGGSRMNQSPCEIRLTNITGNQGFA